MGFAEQLVTASYLSCPISPSILGGVPAREEYSECSIGAPSITLSPCTATITLGLKVVKNAWNKRAATNDHTETCNLFHQRLSS